MLSVFLILHPLVTLYITTHLLLLPATPGVRFQRLRKALAAKEIQEIQEKYTFDVETRSPT